MRHNIHRTITSAREGKALGQADRAALRDALDNPQEWFLYTAHRYSPDAHALVGIVDGYVAWFWFETNALEFCVFMEFWKGTNTGNLEELDQFLAGR